MEDLLTAFSVSVNSITVSANAQLVSISAYMDLYKVLCKVAGLGVLALNETQPANKLFAHTVVTLVQELYVLLCIDYVHMQRDSWNWVRLPQRVVQAISIVSGKATAGKVIHKM